MKRKVALLTMLPMLALSVAGITAASAHGWFQNATPEEIADRQTNMFQQQADLFGISVDQMKEYWAQGKTFKEIADDLGITQEELSAKMQAEHQARMQEHLQTLVDQGVITQSQADQRLQFMESHMEGAFGKMGHGHGFGRMHGFGF